MRLKILSKNNITSPFKIDKLLKNITLICSFFAGAILTLIFLFLIFRSFPAIQNLGVARFLTDDAWFPLEDEFLTVPMILGSMLVTALSVLIATPLAIAVTLYCRLYGDPVTSKWLRSIVKVLAGVPSVVFGFWGLTELVPLISKINPPGPSLLAGGLVLSIMILPTIMLLLDASFDRLPKGLTLASASLSLSKWTTFRYIYKPYLRSGIVTSLLMGITRALGETMAIMMVCGNVSKVPDSIFDPVRTLTANIALEMSYASGLHQATLFSAGLLLLSVVFIIVVLMGIFEKRLRI